MRRALSIGFIIGLAVTLTVAGVVVSAGRPATRGADLENFRLHGPTGKEYSIESFSDRSVLVIYFGYLTCQRACPTALNRIAEAIDRLGAQGASVQPIFIDMDPERAALMSMPLFMRSFGPSFLGLTGSPDEVGQAANAFKVEVERTQFSAEPADYAMKHTSPIFVMRPGDPHPSSLPAASSTAAIEAALRQALRATPEG